MKGVRWPSSSSSSSSASGTLIICNRVNSNWNWKVEQESGNRMWATGIISAIYDQVNGIVSSTNFVCVWVYLYVCGIRRQLKMYLSQQGLLTVVMLVFLCFSFLLPQTRKHTTRKSFLVKCEKLFTCEFAIPCMLCKSLNVL